MKFVTNSIKENKTVEDVIISIKNKEKSMVEQLIDYPYQHNSTSLVNNLIQECEQVANTKIIKVLRSILYEIDDFKPE